MFQSFESKPRSLSELLFVGLVWSVWNSCRWIGLIDRVVCSDFTFWNLTFQVRSHETTETINTFASKYSIVRSRLVSFSLSRANRPRHDRSTIYLVNNLMLQNWLSYYRKNSKSRQSSWCCRLWFRYTLDWPSLVESSDWCLRSEKLPWLPIDGSAVLTNKYEVAGQSKH